MALISEDLAAISEIVRESTNLVLGELGRTEQRFYGRFDKMEQELQAIREDIHTTRYSNETVEILLKKVTELENRIAELEKTA